MRCRKYLIADKETKLCAYKFLTPGGILCANKELKDTIRCTDQEFQTGLYELLVAGEDNIKGKEGEV